MIRLIGYFLVGIWGLAALGESVDVSVQLESEFAASRGIGYLGSTQADDGRWGRHPGVTALCVIALTRGRDRNASVAQEAVTKALPAVRKFAESAILAGTPRDTTHVYSCAASLLALSVAGGDEDAARIAGLRTYLADFLNRRLGSGALLAPGGAVDMPDVSNLHWAIDAILLTREDGVGDDLAVKIQRFVERCQVMAGDEAGGFAYAPIRGGVKPVVWGSLSWAGTRSLLLSGVAADDERLQAAEGWLTRRRTTKENPGLGQGGYFYYLYLLSGTRRLFSAADPNFDPGPWRNATLNQLLSRQQGNGGWRNTDATWLENQSALCTAYAILTISTALQ